MYGYSLAHIAMHVSPHDVVADAVRTARRLTGADAAFAAVACGSNAYCMTALEAISDPRWEQLRIVPGRGLGGKALVESRPCVTADYLNESTITGDYRVVVRAEGLRGMSCVPIDGPDGVVALLYIGDRRIGAPSDERVELLTRVADIAEVGLTLAERHAATSHAHPAALASLTPRERDVLELLCEGASNRRIAERLAIAESTVKGYIRALMEKFEASSRLDVVARARARR